MIRARGVSNLEGYRGVAILSAIPKRFKLLVYRGMYTDLKNLMSIVHQSTWLHEEPIDNNEPIGVCIFRALNSIGIRLIPSIRIFQRLLIVCVINCCWMTCLWVLSPQDACGWDLICQGESRKLESVTQFLRISRGHRVFHREVIWDHFASSGLSAEYRWFSITSMYSSTPMTWNSFFLSVNSRTVWKLSRIWTNCRSGATETHCSSTLVSVRL
jgi:hypothetical protein